MYQFLISIIRYINSLVNNYGIAIIIFTLLIRIILFPLNLKSRISMKKMSSLNPKTQELQRKYGNDKEKLNMKIQELYRKEGVNPLSGCLPMLLSFPILIIMFNAMRIVANEETIKQVFSFVTGEKPVYEGFLWIKNLWMPDSPFYPQAPTVDMIRTISLNEWQSVFNALPLASQEMVKQAIPNIQFTNQADLLAAVSTALNAIPQYVESTSILSGWENINLFIAKMSVFRYSNGFLILPVLAASTQYISTLFMPQQPTAQEGAPNTSFMKWFFPLFSAWICLSYNAIFALYWVAANLFSIVENLIMNKFIVNSEDSQEIKNEQ